MMAPSSSLAINMGQEALYMYLGLYTQNCRTPPPRSISTSLNRVKQKAVF